jgi:hypothetical protein
MTGQPTSRQRLQWEAEKRAQALGGVFDELTQLVAVAGCGSALEEEAAHSVAVREHSRTALTACQKVPKVAFRPRRGALVSPIAILRLRLSHTSV